ncbi:MAG: sensor histidine kinase [Phormidesmis sp.]
MDLSEALASKKDEIIERWMSQVQGKGDASLGAIAPPLPQKIATEAKEHNRTIESAHNLTYKAILDSLPKLLDTLESLLLRPTSEDIADLLQTGLVHGALRARQGYDAEEIVREYATLRSIIFEAIETELLSSDRSLILRTVRLIDGAIDRVIAFSLKRYTEERLSAVNLLYDELLASNQELDRLVRNERMSLAHLAHELKSPLSSIIGYSDLFLRQHDKGEVHPGYVKRALTGGRQLLELINDALEMSSYKAGKVKLTLGSVRVCSVVEEVAVVLETLAQQKGLTLSVGCSPIEQPIITDKGRLRQILTNLISNAIRYTEAGSIYVGVRVVAATDKTDALADGSPLSGSGFADDSLSETSSFEKGIQAGPTLKGSRVEIAVIDTGLGIDMTEQAQIFEPYYRGKAGQQLSCSTGLGLAITYQMVKLLQGSIHLQSEPGGGSTFTIALPLAYQTPNN